jgi:hypothetical protein
MPRTWIWTRIRTWTGSVAGVRERRVSRSDSSDVIRAIDIRSGRHTRAWPDGGGPALRSGSRNRQAARVEFFTPAHAWSKITRLPGSAAVVVGAAAVLPRSIATVTGQSSSVVDRTTSSPGTPSSAPAAREGIPTSSASPGRSPFRPCDTTARCEDSSCSPTHSPLVGADRLVVTLRLNYPPRPPRGLPSCPPCPRRVVLPLEHEASRDEAKRLQERSRERQGAPVLYGRRRELARRGHLSQWEALNRRWPKARPPWPTTAAPKGCCSETVTPHLSRLRCRFPVLRHRGTEAVTAEGTT